MRGDKRSRKFVKALRNVLLVLGLITAPFVGLYLYCRFEATWLQVERLSIPIEGLPASLEGFRIVQLSDIHVDPYVPAKLIEEMVAISNQMAKAAFDKPRTNRRK